MNESDIEGRYADLFGMVPENVKERVDLAKASGREEALEIIEQLRDTLIHHNPLERKIQQLVHLGMLLAMGREEPARLHAQAALQAGATKAELHGVCETAAIVGGMPAYSLGVHVCSLVLAEETGEPSHD